MGLFRRQRDNDHGSLPFDSEILFDECDPATGRILTAEELRAREDRRLAERPATNAWGQGL